MKLQTLINQIFQVDAFTTEPFKGNPAGVVFLNDLNNVPLMQKMALEMNLSETAFICEAKETIHIRFFTPYSEIPLCGHATMAAAHVLYSRKIFTTGETIVFKSLRNDLIINSDEHGIKMIFPTYKLQEMPAGKDFTDITGLSQPTNLYKTEHGWFMAYYDDTLDVIKAHPHIHHMKHSDFGHLIITAPGDKKEGFDYVVRCFVPALGIDEDPVTGSAQCALVPFWKSKLGKHEFTAFQASTRSGILHLKWLDDEKIEITGSAITIFEGVLKI
jgi:PhzF family phenazine biosynthesis protein